MPARPPGASELVDPPIAPMSITCTDVTPAGTVNFFCTPL
jgi:hypothetical protein